MASTNKTQNIELSQFTETDRPEWLQDYNQDMNKIDSAVTANQNQMNALDPDGEVQTAGGIKEYVQNINISLEKVYPVGSIYTSMINQSPADLFGFGVWERISKGRVLVGVDENDGDFQQVGTMGGSKHTQMHTHNGPRHTHTGPSHTHARGTLVTAGAGQHNHKANENRAFLVHIPNGTGSTTFKMGSVGAEGGNTAGQTTTQANHSHTISGNTAAGGTGNTGTSGDAATSSYGTGNSQNLQPYMTCYMWTRTG